MSAIRPERDTTCKLGRVTCVGLIFWAPIILAIANMISVNGAQNSSSKDNAAVLRGHEPVEIIGTLVAMTRYRWENIGYSFHVLLFKVDGVLSGKESAKFVRADFPATFTYTNSEEARAYSHLESLLREPKSWKVHLRPPHGSVLCAWTIPAPPRPDDLAMAGTPIIVSVGGASGYPDINTVPCYVLNQGDIQEVLSPETPGKKSN